MQKSIKSNHPPSKVRTICYVDGFNLYYGLKNAGLKDCNWLNIQALAQSLVKSPFTLQRTKYFTARIRGVHPDDSSERALIRESSRLRQQRFLDALGTLKAFDILEGQFLMKRNFCRKCNSDFFQPEEKMTDVRIATELLTDAFLDRFDSAILISGDSDLVPPIASVLDHFPQKTIAVAFPPKRRSLALQNSATTTLQIWTSTLRKCQFPETVLTSRGITLQRPIEWR